MPDTMEVWQLPDNMPSRGSLERAIYMHEQMEDDMDTAERMRPVLDVAKAVLGGKRIVLHEASWCSTHRSPATEPKDESCQLEELTPALWVEGADDE